MTWKPMDKAHVVFEMDSSPAGAEVITFNNILQEYGFPMCVSTTTHSMGPIKVLSLHEVENHGGEITSHTHSGKVLNSYVPWEDVEYEFKTSLDIFRQHDFNVNGIMLMGGGGQNQPDPTKREDTTEKYRAEIEKYVSKYYKYSDLYGVSAQYYNPRKWLYSGWSSTKSYIDNAIKNKDWVVIATHGYDDIVPYSEKYLRQVLDYLKEKEDAGLLEVVTYKHIYKNFGNWQGDVDFGDTKYTVDFYSTDKKTLLGSSVVVEGKAAEEPLLDIAGGVKFNGWSQSIDKVTDNMSVYADCSYNDGTKVSETDASPLKEHADHTWGNFTVDKNGHIGACTVCGEKSEKVEHTFKDNVCSTCGYKKQSSVSTEVNHTHKLSIVKEKAATCVKSGTKKHYKCSCGALFADAKGKTVIIDPDALSIAATDKHTDKNGDKLCDICKKKLSSITSTTVMSSQTTTVISGQTTTAASVTATKTTAKPDASKQPDISEDPDVSEPIDGPITPEPAVDNDENILAYILIGIAATVVIAAAIVVILLYRKKKATSPTE